MLPSLACLFGMFSMLISIPGALVMQFEMAEISSSTPLLQ